MKTVFWNSIYRVAIKIKSLSYCLRLLLPVGAKIIVLNYTGNEANWGCVGTCRGLISLLREAYPCARIQTVPIRYHKDGDSWPLPPSVDDIDEYIEVNFSKFPDHNLIKWASVVVLNGEGSVHEWPQSARRPEPQMRLIEVYAAKRKFPNKRVMAVNQSVDFCGDDFGQWVSVGLSPIDLVSVREPFSRARLEALGLKNVRLVPDAAFLTPAISRDVAKQFLGKRGIAEGYIAMFLGENISKVSADFLCSLIENLEGRYRRQVVLFVAPKVDLVVAEKICKAVKVHTIGMEASPEMLVGALKLSSLVISGRYHCCIYSALAGTPFVPFRSNTDKIEGLVRLLDYPISVEVFESMELDQILGHVGNVWEQRRVIRPALEVNVGTLVRGVTGSCPLLRGLP